MTEHRSCPVSMGASRGYCRRCSPERYPVSIVSSSSPSCDKYNDFFGVCGSLYKFYKKPTVAIHYKGDTLKRLLDQRWTGHLATVTAVLKSFDDIFFLLSEIDSNRAFGIDLRIEAAGLIVAIEVIGRFVQKILQLLDAPNKMLQSEQMDLLSGMQLVKSASECVAQLR